MLTIATRRILGSLWCDICPIEPGLAFTHTSAKQREIAGGRSSTRSRHVQCHYRNRSRAHRAVGIGRSCSGRLARPADQVSSSGRVRQVSPDSTSGRRVRATPVPDRAVGGTHPRLQPATRANPPRSWSACRSTSPSQADNAGSQVTSPSRLRAGSALVPRLPACSGDQRSPAVKVLRPTGWRVPRSERGLTLVRGVGLAGIEPATSPLSGVRSNRLSYSPARKEVEPIAGRDAAANPEPGPRGGAASPGRGGEPARGPPCGGGRRSPR
jgi:hypothetical protein